MIDAFLAAWEAIVSLTVAASVTARGVTLDYARAEAEYQCTKTIAERCRELELDLPAYYPRAWPECNEDVDGIAVCTLDCEAECTAPEPTTDTDDE